MKNRFILLCVVVLISMNIHAQNMKRAILEQKYKADVRNANLNVFSNNSNSSIASCDIVSLGKEFANDVFVGKINVDFNVCTDLSITPKATVYNIGTASQTFPVTMEITGGYASTKTVSTLAAGDSMEVEFDNWILAEGMQTASVYTGLVSDENTLNDTLIKPFPVILLKPPFSMGFENADTFNLSTIIDDNNDGYKWNINVNPINSGVYALGYVYNDDGTTAADDWFILPCIQLESSKTYSLSFWVRAMDAAFPEKLNVNIGTGNQVSSLTTSIVDLENIVNSTFAQSTSNFTVPADGKYFIGFHCYSDADKFAVVVDDINVSLSTGVEAQHENAFYLYPNPAKKYIYVESANEIKHVRLINLYGQLISSLNINNFHAGINVEMINDGVYLLEIETKDGISTKKVIVNNK